MNKEEMLNIMGKYYGNAHYRRCGNDSAHDLILTTELLDEVNALGYYFSNAQRIVETCDLRFPEILKRYIGKFDSVRYSEELISAFGHKEYWEHVPYLLELYSYYENDDHMCFCISDVVLRIKSKRFADEYIRIISEPGYEKHPDMFYVLVCKLKLKQAVPRLIGLLNLNKDGFKWFFVENIWRFREPELMEYVIPFLEDANGELRAEAKKALRKMEVFEKEKLMEPQK